MVYLVLLGLLLLMLCPAACSPRPGLFRLICATTVWELLQPSNIFRMRPAGRTRVGVVVGDQEEQLAVAYETWRPVLGFLSESDLAGSGSRWLLKVVMHGRGWPYAPGIARPHRPGVVRICIAHSVDHSLLSQEGTRPGFSQGCLLSLTVYCLLADERCCF